MNLRHAVRHFWPYLRGCFTVIPLRGPVRGVRLTGPRSPVRK